MRNLLFALLFSLAGPAAAQSLHFCAAYMPDGTAMGESGTWNIYEGGGNVYLLFRHDDVLPKRGLEMNIFRVFGDSVVKLGTEYLKSEEGKSWAVVDYHFAEAGEYKVIVTSMGATLDSKVLTVTYLRPGTDYSTSAMQFCTKVSEGQPSDTLRSVQLTSGVAKARAFLACPDGLSCTKITVDVWKREGRDFSKFVSTEDFEVEPGWRFTQFLQSLSERGDYRLMVYSDAGVWINSAEIAVE
jgi:hypothetical protein